MALKSQKHLFSIDEDVVYFNIASFSPAFKSVEEAGIKAINKKSQPQLIKSADLFEPVVELRKLFAKIIDEDDVNRVVTVPSVSYGLATVANNITLKKDDEIIIVEEQFPSNYYVWEALAIKFDAKIITIKQPEHIDNWNQHILNHINPKTALVAIGQIHWANGFIFDLKAIRVKTKAVNALLIIDGSQSIGALPFSIKNIQPDALVCAGYKWLFGPYGCAYAYYGDYFDNGEPIEYSWVNRKNSEYLSGLTSYQSDYKPKAHRYAMGQSGSFIYVKTQIEALKEVIKISAFELQDYCYQISESWLEKLHELGFESDAPHIRAKHLFGIKIPSKINAEDLKSHLEKHNIYVSIRGNYMRLSCHIFNTESDFEKLYNTLKSL